MAKQAINQVQLEDRIEAARTVTVQSIREQDMVFTSDVRGKSFGVLSSLADPALIPQENGAFEKAMVAKHAHKHPTQE